MKKILINARHPQEKRVAIIRDGRLLDYYVELQSANHLRSNIYKGVITGMDQGLHAAFVNFGGARDGFLPLKEVMPENYIKPYSGDGLPQITDVLEKGQKLVVQVEQDPRGSKGAKLTNNLSLPGRYMIMIPGEERFGISRKIDDRSARERLKEAFKGLRAPKNTGFILRTAGVDCSTEELSADLKYLTKLWNKITREAKKATAPSLIYKEEDIAVRTVRDYLKADVEEVIIDDLATHRTVANFLKLTMPWQEANLTHYDEALPLFDHYGLQEQIDHLSDREVRLPSGGSIIIDKVEALTAIDVNSGRGRDKDIESLALKTNLEAAEEIARQLRLRDIGGLIVIDFIDLRSSKHYRAIEDLLKKKLERDKAHYDITRISKFGLLELSRERMRTAHFDTTGKTCKACGGSGTVIAPEIVGVSVLRQIHLQATSLRPETKERVLHCSLSVDNANYVMNNLRESLTALETEFSVKVMILVDPMLSPGDFSVSLATPAGEAPAQKQQQRQKKQKSPQPQPQQKQQPQAQQKQQPKPQPRPQTETVKAAAPAGESVQVLGEDGQPVQPGKKKRRSRSRSARKRRRTERLAEQGAAVQGGSAAAQDQPAAGTASGTGAAAAESPQRTSAMHTPQSTPQGSQQQGQQSTEVEKPATPVAAVPVTEAQGEATQGEVAKPMRRKAAAKKTTARKKAAPKAAVQKAETATTEEKAESAETPKAAAKKTTRKSRAKRAAGKTVAKAAPEAEGKAEAKTEAKVVAADTSTGQTPEGGAGAVVKKKRPRRRRSSAKKAVPEKTQD